MLKEAQVENRATWIVKQLYGLEPEDQRAILKRAHNKLFPNYEKKPAPTISTEDREAAFWKGLDANLEKGDAPTLKLYAEMKEAAAARDVTKDVRIYIEHDDIPDMVLRQALEGTGVDFGGTCKGIEEAASVPYSPPG